MKKQTEMTPAELEMLDLQSEMTPAELELFNLQAKLVDLILATQQAAADVQAAQLAVAAQTADEVDHDVWQNIDLKAIH